MVNTHTALASLAYVTGRSKSLTQAVLNAPAYQMEATRFLLDMIYRALQRILPTTNH